LNISDFKKLHSFDSKWGFKCNEHEVLANITLRL